MPSRFSTLFALLIAALAANTIAAQSATAPAALALPDDWYPESVARDADGAFYAGSWRQGAVVRIAADGSSRMLVPPGSNGLANVQGVLVDETAQLLWVCSGNMGFTTVPQTPSALKSYALASGKPVASYLLPDRGYCNDLVQDSHGTLYVSDSKNPRVLRLPRDGAALQVWLALADHPAGKDGFFFNGIALDGDDQLYLSEVSATDHLLRIGITADGTPAAPATIRFARPLKNADAIRSAGPGRLVIFESNAFGNDGPYGGQISIASISDNTGTLQTLVAGLNDPSSGVVADGRVYFIESKYGLLIKRTQDKLPIPQHVPFDLQSQPLP
ncbi:hypothetical protein IGB42_03627 [Andreprevotia sp. IGB-42]|uniref:hypothetical protein n=1 Tax=Andreprevotia sp. IGB-42 TaxID=2497473 RepID=UPI001358FE8C|nr:hypothetical protein [Andreprevotia sp. IGB-42]KAF0811817.1 hypothetical protein IGB42_03627 [Andreprevotia sp. IGB-42]